MKENEFIYLTMYQGFALAGEIEKLQENPYFKDVIAASFVEDVLKGAAQITVNSLNNKTSLIQKIKKNGNKLEIPKSKFEYVTRLTGIDVFDEEVMKQHMEMLNEYMTVNKKHVR